MMKRVSSRLRDSGTPFVSSNSKCLIHTAPVGNDQVLAGLNPIVRFVLGTDTQRVLIALSDQKGTLRSYATMPAAGTSVARFVNALVPASVAGTGAPFVVLL